MIVVDASVAVKWFIDEPDSEAAAEFLARFEDEIAGPDLLTIEVSRALVAAINSRRVDAEVGRAAIGAWLASIDEQRIALFRSDARIVDQGVEIALNLGHPLADCLYLALAIHLDCGLATADRKFATRAGAIYDRIELVGAR